MNAGQNRWVVVAAALAVLAAPGASRAAGTNIATTPVSFTDTLGRAYDQKTLSDGTTSVVVFLSTQCPICNVYTPRLQTLATSCAAQGVRLLAAFPDTQESVQDVARYVKERKLSFPAIRDGAAALAAKLGASVTPEAFVLDGKGEVRYHGRIDNNAVATRVTVQDLHDAIGAVITGAAVRAAHAPSVGCAIRRTAAISAKPGEPTYAVEVSRILRAKCENCHRPGEVAPFSLQNYKQASAWAPDIKRYTQNHQMPPWKPEANFGSFRDEPEINLTESERTVLAKWADAGAPLGDSKRLPPVRTFPTGWRLGQPDAVITPPREYHLSADGDDVYRHFVVKTNFTEDRYLSAVEVRPGCRAVVHHVIAYVDGSPGSDGQYASEKLEAATHDGEPGYTSFGGPGFVPTGIIGGWAPGNDARVLPEGIGIFVPKGARLSVEVHYHKDGKQESDLTQLGIHFVRSTVRKQISGMFTVNFGFQIPPGAERHEVTAVSTVGQDSHILVVTPHMHLLGKEMKLWAELPNGEVKPLVWIKDWDFNWQNSYYLKEPLAVPKGTRVKLTAYFDNSDTNPRNPSKGKQRTVRWGEQTTDEMCIAFVSLTKDDEHLNIAPPTTGVVTTRNR